MAEVFKLFFFISLMNYTPSIIKSLSILTPTYGSTHSFDTTISLTRKSRARLCNLYTKKGHTVWVIIGDYTLTVCFIFSPSSLVVKCARSLWEISLTNGRCSVGGGLTIPGKKILQRRIAFLLLRFWN